jgi:leukotriene A-4 hydrolase/aminopeptidase
MPTHAADAGSTRDPHSYANPDEVRVTHVDLDLTADFEKKTISGTSTLAFVRSAADAPLVLDTRDLTITGVETSTDGRAFAKADYTVGSTDPVLGAPLTVKLPSGVKAVRVAYASSPGAGALQWLEPSQTAGKKHPFLFTQGQSILTRTWIPLQDTPSVRATYSARIRTPKELVAVMSAENHPDAARDGDYSFEMKQPIPSYLIALAVGDIAFRPMGKRTGVYAEPSVVDKAAWEFADTEKMVEVAERLYGPYRWGRYDLLVLPPSFPFGGMENPRLTFATPTVIAGDRSLVSLVAHELAHSWSGNLVTNATWSDFWLNEGFTTYVERRILEEVYGRAREEMEAQLGRQTLGEELDGLDDRDESLYVNLVGRDPEDAFSQVPYEKGALFLRQIEETFGRARFDAWMRGYFDHFAFRSITTAEFLAYLRANLLDKEPALAAKIPVEEWIFRPGVPASAPSPQSDAFAKVEAAARPWIDGKAPAASIRTSGWTTQEWQHFLKYLPDPLGRERMSELDAAFGLSKSGNAEVEFQWLLMAIRSGYEPAYPRLEEYLVGIGRRKLIKPLYDELVKTPEGKERATAIYRKARPGYHPVSVGTIDAVVGWGN